MVTSIDQDRLPAESEVLLRILEMSQKDIEAGRVYPAEEVFAELREEIKRRRIERIST